MASKRQNMFYENKKQEMTEIGEPRTPLRALSVNTFRTPECLSSSFSTEEKGSRGRRSLSLPSTPKAIGEFLSANDFEQVAPGKAAFSKETCYRLFSEGGMVVESTIQQIKGPDGVVVRSPDYHAIGPGFDSLRERWDGSQKGKWTFLFWDRVEDRLISEWLSPGYYQLLRLNQLVSVYEGNCTFGVPETVGHVLLECRKYGDLRREYVREMGALELDKMVGKERYENFVLLVAEILENAVGGVEKRDIDMLEPAKFFSDLPAMRDLKMEHIKSMISTSMVVI
ncbi:hypothetical protein AAG570_004648 [Ranatra chinensis]|uniref:Uncharacterized protein n=1 Tax=Ranatra chinensis TaxID=642074 RepID=A0ABD0Y1F8_9HEMI